MSSTLARGLSGSAAVSELALLRLWRNTINAMIASTRRPPTTLPAIVAFVPDESPPLVPSPVAELGADAVEEVVAVAVDEPELPVKALVVVAATSLVATAVTSKPATQEILPPVESGMLACLSKACSPMKRVALLVQSQLPGSFCSFVYALTGTEQPAHGYSLASSSMASQRVRPTHSWASKSSDFQGQELSVYCESVHPAM